MKPRNFNRRQFLETAASAAAFGAVCSGAGRRALIVTTPDDPVASSAPVHWACEELRGALAAAGVPAEFRPNLEHAGAGDLCILVAGARENTARAILTAAKSPVPDAPEALALASGKAGGKPVLLASGIDTRGAVYAVLELADRVRHASDPVAAIHQTKTIVERPANSIRSIARCFESDVEDKSWFYDRDMWRAYLSMLAAQRFNRFSLTLGLGYNFPRNVRDVYFYFSYPYLLSVPGYNVRVSNLPDAERDRNLETLRFIGEETAARGLHFQLGLWTHAYQWQDSPNANATIEGLNPENHAPYCRDALHALLEACPSISGLTFRIHGESGISEGSYDFWQTLFQGIVRTGRKIEIDMHAKGMDRKMIDLALGTGMPVNISPKYWAEHMGLPYHQAAIRDLEMAREAKPGTPFTLSAGSRNFMRYGWGDLLEEHRDYGVLHRIWPGTQRVLLWGDPALAAGYGRYSSFCGTQGVELCEPLSFKGRMGSGLPGGRCSYSDASLNPKYDWEKYLYTYRMWGRSIYNPDTDPEGWRRYLRRELGSAAQPAEAALANASRILLLITTAHGASASNNAYWPEIYTNMPVVDPHRKHPYGDTPQPRRFGTVSPFDPQLFSRIDDFASELLSGERAARYSPLDWAQWLDDFSTAAATHLKAMNGEPSDRRSAAHRRVATDVAIQAGTGRFFAHKVRSAMLWAIYEKIGDKSALSEALEAYRSARAAWAEMANSAKAVYMADITYGMTPHLRGHWLDRLPAIDDDIADMEKARSQPPPPAAGSDPDRVRAVVREILTPPRRHSIPCRHDAPPHFRPGDPLALELAVDNGAAHAVVLHYRRVNQAEQWRSAEMQPRENRYRAVIAGEYTQSPYGLEYYFELRDAAKAPHLYPGFQPDLSNQPYFLVRQARS